MTLTGWLGLDAQVATPVQFALQRLSYSRKVASYGTDFPSVLTNGQERMGKEVD